MVSKHFTPPSRHSRSSSDPASTSTSSSHWWHDPSISPPSIATSFAPQSPFSWTSSRRQRIPLRSTVCQRFNPIYRWLVIVICISLAVLLSQRCITTKFLDDAEIQSILQGHTTIYDSTFELPDTVAWFRENSNNAHSREWERSPSKTLKQVLGYSRRSSSPRPKAAIISLVRNEELEGIMQSIRQLEYHWNRKYQYDWIFFNEKPFSDEFKAATSNLTAAQTFYELIPKEHWSTPSSVDENRYMNSLDYLGAIGVGKGFMLSYRNMCRWNSGFFYKHPRLLDYDFYWRVEPDVHFFCDIDYDPFRFLRDNNVVYGFNMLILDDARSFPSLFSQTQDFINSYPELIHPEADLSWLTDPRTGEYNNCQFFSNFEIGDLRFFRSEANEKYFEFLDRNGGFYYERFGDAPIHTLSLALFAPKDRVHFFRDIGYQHDIARHCPPESVSGICTCNPTGLDENFYKLIPMESPQRKPDDTCIRQFLGGRWLEKKKGWDQDAERAFGGDGFQGYVLDGTQ